jgi:hypothetical protein
MPMSEIKKLNTIIKGQKAKIDNIEERMKDIFEEYTDLTDALTGWISGYAANDQGQLYESFLFTQKLLEKLRKKYG